MGAVVVRGTNSAHVSRIGYPPQHLQVLLPQNQVVYLIEVDIVLEECECALCLCPALTGSLCPHLGGYNYPISPAMQRFTQHTLGLSIHRRRIEEVGTRCQCSIHHCASVLFSDLPAHIKCSPGAHSNDRHL